MNFTETLQRATVEKRVDLIQQKYEKNLSYFSSFYPEVYQHLISAKSEYRIDLTTDFLDIVSERTGERCHPERLDLFAQMLGDWGHKGWIDLHNFVIPCPLKKFAKHNGIINEFIEAVLASMPVVGRRLTEGQFFLPDTGVDKKYSPPVVFVGLFHALHIDYFLTRTELDSALFIEPELGRFEVSCYFLDYSELEKRFGRLFLALGEKPDSTPIRDFFSYGRVTPMIWSRVLPGYASVKNDPIISSLRLFQQVNHDALIPLDIEFDSIENGWQNLKQQLPLLTSAPLLSAQARIAVVAPGPSLSNDIRWLKKNRKNLIIFAVHGAVMPLLAAGIIPDFQFALEVNKDSIVEEIFQIDPDVPLIAIYFSDQTIKGAAKKILMVGTVDRYNIVELSAPVPFVNPSTGSFAFAVALFCNPKFLYLIGLDLGFRDTSKTHVKNSFYETEQIKKIESDEYQRIDTCTVAANFPDSVPVFSKPFYNQTRLSIERAITHHRKTTHGDCKIYNFSDGARIDGAVATRAASYGRVVNVNVGRDKEAIIKAFGVAEEGKNWHKYKVAGKPQLAEFKKILLGKLAIKNFSIEEFARMVDELPLGSLRASNMNDSGQRMECYLRVVMDLMAYWYRFMLFCHTPSERELLYRVGHGALKKIINELDWPADEI